MALENPAFVTLADDIITSGKTDEFTQVVKDLAAAMARQTPAAAPIDRNVFSQRMGKLSARSYSKVREVAREFYLLGAVPTIFYRWSICSRDARFVRRGDLSGPIIFPSLRFSCRGMNVIPWGPFLIKWHDGDI